MARSFARRRRPIERLQHRLGTMGGGLQEYRSREQRLQQRPFLERVVRPLIARFQGIGSAITSVAQKEDIRRKLAQAGFPGGLTLRQILGIRVFLMLLAPGFGLFFLITLNSFLHLGIPLWLYPLNGLVLMGLGYMSLSFIVGALVRKRQKLIRKTLPDVLDLLTIAVEAGLGFDQAMDRVGQRYRGPMGDELLRTVQEIRMGRPRVEALRDLGDRTGVEEVNTLATAIVQADRLGVSIGNVLRAHAEQMRRLRAQRAREQAQKAPTKMMIPLVLFIFPALFIVLLAPAGLQALKTLRESELPGF
ncbi:MAG TPA: type II secretion system F family protein [Armatimonadetes bacterium]|nr:type II secretion system F family protein [Armatimonadota bacterium]